jgi:hypothetical protein
MSKKSVREAYIIRIYRRDKKNPSNLVGIVEIIDTDEKMSFRNLNDLWDILNFNNATK